MATIRLLQSLNCRCRRSRRPVPSDMTSLCVQFVGGHGNGTCRQTELLADWRIDYYSGIRDGNKRGYGHILCCVVSHEEGKWTKKLFRKLLIDFVFLFTRGKVGAHLGWTPGTVTTEHPAWEKIILFTKNVNCTTPKLD